jgi:DNA-binding transcriptional LysR family regulator
MVASGIGMTLVPTLAADNNKNIAYIPFSKPKPMRTIGLVSRATSSRRLLLDELMRSIKEIMQKHEVVTIK